MESINQSANNQTKKILLGLGGCLFLCLCLVCTAVIGMSGYIFYLNQGDLFPVEPDAGITPTAVLPATAPPTPVAAKLTPTSTAVPPTATPPPTAAVLNLDVPEDIDQQPIPLTAQETLERLFIANYPSQDYFETAERLGNKELGDRTITAPAYQLGDTQSFFVDDDEIEATLMGLTDNVYFWVENGLNFELEDVQRAADKLEVEYYPRLTNLFGQEWQPGVDNDPHFSVLHLVGSNSAGELGYFSTTDEFPRTLYRDSNEQEIVYLNMSQLELGKDLYYGTLVHEVQHLIQWYTDPNETAWLNEGLSQLAEIYLGLDTADTFDYERNPEIRLNSWAYDSDDVDAHYSAAYMFLVYIWEQLGETAVQELSRHPANGMASVSAVLGGFDGSRDLTQFIADWVAANYLDDFTAGVQYGYQALDPRPPTINDRWRDVPQELVEEMEQFGTHFIDLDFRGDITISFAGDTTAALTTSQPRSGTGMWFVPAEDELDAQLTAEFDLTGLSRATLGFAAWYDLEEDYDFAYVSVSTDGGQTWELLSPDHQSPGEYGPAFNGRSTNESDSDDGWVKETISLNRFTGAPVQIRFEVLTDSAITGRGFAVDDISIPELGYLNDAEGETSPWQADGFVQTNWLLPQQWIVQLIEPGAEPHVTRLPLNELNQGQWRLSIGGEGAVLTITPATPFTDDRGSYWLSATK